MFPDLEFIKTCLNAITAKFRRVQSNVDAVQSNVDAVQSNVDAVQSNVDAVKSDVDAVKSDVDAVRSDAPDWYEPDTASHAYVKNKPCYDYAEPSVVIWESDNAGTSSQSAMVLVDLADGWLIEGETYRLTVDGVETTYTCAADAKGRGLYIGAGYSDANNGSIFKPDYETTLRAYTNNLWYDGQKVRLEGPLRRYKKLDTSLYDAVVSVNGETGDVQITPEKIGAANAGTVIIVSNLVNAIYGTRNGNPCDVLYLGGNRGLYHSTTTDTGEDIFYFGPYDTLLAGIKTPTINDQAANKGYVDKTVAAPRDSIRLYSSTEGSTKQFELTVNDDGVISVAEVAE